MPSEWGLHAYRASATKQKKIYDQEKIRKNIDFTGWHKQYSQKIDKVDPDKIVICEVPPLKYGPEKLRKT